MKKHGPPGRGGFSFLELMVAVVIIGIIASIVVPRVSVSADSAKGKTRDHHIAHLNHLVELHHIEHDAWPTSLDDLAPQLLPDGPPDPPQGGSYTINPASHRVEHTPGP
ncbi:Type II secretion system protein G precursor [Posidoniimonas corsicana]|uniref:Type II secretion system protein G n=1 Tax=Posidoniimonas corsicana TaxID=1938618 RepID=A0A5C5VCG7_9BACT|nr:prepilin-type N-terminal cleavage/methylation domain-containing protein [Posidoniimonas corsicana]TWT35305.1 Type II secretion system protein G precursor [Posidoniimonas corsicana]